MPQIVTPLAQVLNPQVQQTGTQTGFLAPAAAAGQTRVNDLRDRKEEDNLQRLSNLGQGSLTGLNIIKRDPENAEAALREMIAQRKIVNPALGITDTTDTDELEKALNEGGVPAAQELLQGALDAATSSGFKLPKPTTPDFEQTFTAIGASGKPEIFFRSDQGAIPTGLLAPPKTPLVQVGPGGGDKERKVEFGKLFDESKNIDKTLQQFTQVKGIIEEGGLGSIGASGRVARGFGNLVSAIGGMAKNLGLGSDDFDEGSIVSKALAGTRLGEQAKRNAKVTSLITNLGFAVARAQGNIRITDKDFEAAIRTIGASADNPEQLLGVLDQFGTNLIDQFEVDVQRTGDAFGFNEGQFKALRNIPSKKGFLSKSTKSKKITANTKPSDLTDEQARKLAKDNPDLLRQIIANAKRGQ